MWRGHHHCGSASGQEGRRGGARNYEWQVDEIGHVSVCNDFQGFSSLYLFLLLVFRIYAKSSLGRGKARGHEEGRYYRLAILKMTVENRIHMNKYILAVTAARKTRFPCLVV